MEQEEVINPNLAVWVMEYNQHRLSPPIWKVDGIALDAYHGFGHKDTRYFNGEVVLLSLDKKLFQHLSLSNVHFSREGFKWLIEDSEYLPQAPFLISSDPAIQIIFNGLIEISEDRKVIDFSEPDDYIYSVGAKGWFGVMAIKGNNQANLVAFSPNQGMTVSESEIWSYEWDCIIGKIKIV